VLTSFFLMETPAKTVLPDWFSYWPSTAFRKMSFCLQPWQVDMLGNYGWTSQHQIARKVCQS